MRKLKACLVLTVFLLTPACISKPVLGPAQKFSSDLQSAIKKISPSLARIRVFALHKEPNVPEHYDIIGIGTGIVISADGHILTNYHVVDRRNYIEVSLSGGKYLPVQVVGTDILKDLALIKIKESPAKPLTAAEFDKQNKAVTGTVILKAGFPKIITSSSVPIFTHGIVSHTRAFLGDFPAPFGLMDAYAMPGDSGGPLFDSNGQVVGITTAIKNGVGYFIPSQIVLEILPRLYKGNVKTGWLGILPSGCVDISEAAKDSFLMKRLVGFLALKGLLVPLTANNGILITKIDKSMAETSILKIGDIVTLINNKRPQDKWELVQWISEVEPGTPVTLDVIRNNEMVKITVTVEEFNWTATPPASDGHSIGF